MQKLVMRIKEYLNASPIFLINRLNEDLTRSTKKYLAEEGLGFLEALVLIAIFFEKPSPVTPSQLANTFSTSRGNVSHCLTALANQNLVKRILHNKDARSYLMQLTDLGQKRAVSLIKKFDALQLSLESKIGVENLSHIRKAVRDLTAATKAAS